MPRFSASSSLVLAPTDHPYWSLLRLLCLPFGVLFFLAMAAVLAGLLLFARNKLAQDAKLAWDLRERLSIELAFRQGSTLSCAGPSASLPTGTEPTSLTMLADTAEPLRLSRGGLSAAPGQAMPASAAAMGALNQASTIQLRLQGDYRATREWLARLKSEHADLRLRSLLIERSAEPSQGVQTDLVLTRVPVPVSEQTCDAPAAVSAQQPVSQGE